MGQSKPFRALIACGVSGTSVVIAYDSPWLGADIEGINDLCDDIGLDQPPESGLWLWEGYARDYASGPNYEPETEYVGQLRAVADEELPALLGMTPPVECVVCRAATARDYHDLPCCMGQACLDRLRLEEAGDA